MTGRIWRVGTLLALMAGVAAVPSEADIIFSQTGGGTGDNVLFKCPAANPDCYDDRSDVTQMIGTFDNGAFEVLFDANVGIEPGASGQATIIEIDAATTWTTLDISWLNFFSTDLVILKITPTTATTDFQLVGVDDDGNIFNSLVFTGVSATAGDFFTVGTLNGQTITRVGIVVTTPDGSLSEVKQVRLGDVFDDDGNVIPSPEPAVLALFGTGLFALGFTVRRKRTQ